MSVELYSSKNHTCLMFTDLVEEEGAAVQANQFLIVDHGEGAVLDPGGQLTFNELFMSLSPYFSPKNLRYLIASHADPDIIASLDRWLTSTSATLAIPQIWARFAPHFAKVGKTDGRVLGVPDGGGLLPLGRADLHLLPAHFMHSEGNQQVYDPVSRILFTGDLGVSLVSGTRAQQPVTDLADHIPHMEGFHRRYMVSNKILRLWVEMVRPLSISMIAPQHGAPIRGERAINDFFDWLTQLECGIDLFGQDNYRLPRERLDPANAR